jgi:hypothetical protein
MEPRCNTEWTNGFIDGEGCFFLKAYTNLHYKINHNTKKFICNFSITQDDKWILDDIKSMFGFGRVYNKNPKQRNPIFSYAVCRVDDIEIICKYFLEHPLILKNQEFKIWMRGFYLHKTIKDGHKMDEIAKEMYDKIYNRLRCK